LSAIAKLPRATKMALVGGLLIVLALAGKGLAGGRDQPVGVSSGAVTPRSGAVAPPRPKTTSTTSPVPLNPRGRNPFAPASAAAAPAPPPPPTARK
jgi:hypothetical protein